MANAFYQVPTPKNEPVLAYRAGSPERQELKAALAAYKAEAQDVPMYINGQWVTTDNLVAIRPPHEIKHTLAHFHKGGSEHVHAAIDASLAAQPAWERMSWQDRAAIFLKAADLISGPYRARMNAATML
ncbi:MAG: aldehyde dehydrogenase family protein, partial [Bacteroidota bacterium]